jgi:hypothetical protein
MSDMKPVEVGGYTLLFPQWWGEIRKRDKGPLSALNSVAAQSVSFDFNVMKGQGSQEQRELILRQLVQGYHGEESRALTLTLAGHAFEGVEILRPKVLAPSDQASVVSFIAIIAGDLLHFTVTVLETSETSLKIRNVAVQVVEGALMRKQTEWGGMEPPSAGKTGPAQGSGLPSHWQLDAEGHPVNPVLVEALAAYKNAPGAETARAMYRALCSAALILAEEGSVSGPPQAGVTSGSTQVRVRTLRAPNGAQAVPAFTDTKHLRAQFPEGTAFRALPASVVAQMLLGGQVPLVLNPGPGGASLALPRKGLEALARGELPELP